MKRKLRVSQYRDYIAVDLVHETEGIIATPFYLRPGEKAEVMYFDHEEKRWCKTEVKITSDFFMLNCTDIDPKSKFQGLDWPSPFEDLTDESQIKFITK